MLHLAQDLLNQIKIKLKDEVINVLLSSFYLVFSHLHSENKKTSLYGSNKVDIALILKIKRSRIKFYVQCCTSICCICTPNEKT